MLIFDLFDRFVLVIVLVIVLAACLPRARLFWESRCAACLPTAFR